ncbi:MAG: xanthine dehydrogenase family protein [Candidatus Coatesbacteria bacterium]|nr:xanthine dehydrogenase family protein [Candidatus Coatesbacteria bacterium]
MKKDKKIFHRVDADEKLRGKALFVDDIYMPDMLYGRIVRSPITRGILNKISIPEQYKKKDLVFVTYKDIPGKNCVSSVESDLPILTEREIRYKGQAIALIAHKDREFLEDVLASLELSIERLPACTDMVDSLNKKEILVNKDNIFRRLRIKKGNADKFLKESYFKSERIYRTPHQEHLYLETQGMIGYMENGVLNIKGSMQCPFYVVEALELGLGISRKRISVQPTTTGGAFGGKEDFPSLLALHAALLTMKAGKPVKMILERGEDIAFTTKRHPSLIKQELGFYKEGKLVAARVKVILDAGAYETLSKVVLSRSILHAMGVYECDNVVIDGELVCTNTPPSGAFRGFGAPQSMFAIESHIDEISSKLKMNPVDIRRINIIKPQSILCTGQNIGNECILPEMLNDALKETRYITKYEKNNIFNSKNREMKKGIGISLFMHGNGFTGNGERILSSRAGLTLKANGSIELLFSNIDMGQGCNTVMIQIASKALQIPPENIYVGKIDTLSTPDSGPTVASRTTLIIGDLIYKASKKLKRILQKSSPREDDFNKKAGKYISEHGELTIIEDYRHPEELSFDDETYQGEAYRSYSLGCNIAEIEVQLDTFQIDIRKFHAYYDIGTVINKPLSEGQIRGGIMQGIGYAMYENLIFENGVVRNNSMTDYIVPTAMDMPQINVKFMKNKSNYGPYGAKGLGELPMNGPPAAINNALRQALGIDFHSIPFLPERILEVWMKKNE